MWEPPYWSLGCSVMCTARRGKAESGVGTSAWGELAIGEGTVCFASRRRQEPRGFMQEWADRPLARRRSRAIRRAPLEAGESHTSDAVPGALARKAWVA